MAKRVVVVSTDGTVISASSCVIVELDEELIDEMTDVLPDTMRYDFAKRYDGTHWIPCLETYLDYNNN